MLGLGLRLASPSAYTRPFLVTTRCFSSRSLLIAAASGRSSTFVVSRILPLVSSPKTFHIRHASTSLSGRFPSVHSIAAVTKAEAEADADPDNVDAQVRLFRLLIESERTAGWRVLMSRWERMCEFVSLNNLLLNTLC